MFHLIRILSICLIFVRIGGIGCNSTTLNPEGDDDRDYDNQTNKKLFNLIEEQDLIDALRETEELQKKIQTINTTKEENQIKSKVNEYLNSDKKQKKKIKTSLMKKNPFVISAVDKVEALTAPLMKKLLPVFLPLADELYNSDLSPECMAALIRLTKGAKEKEIWALKCNHY